MWELVNRTPYLAERTWVQDAEGAKHYVVVVKATWLIKPDGSTELAEEKVEPLLLPKYRGEDGTSSLLYEGDLIAGKPGTDLYVNGSAHAPGGRPAPRVSVALRIGKLEKVLEVLGEQRFGRDLVGEVVPSTPLPFVQAPIIYEHAYGGFDATDPDPSKQKLFDANPVGTGHVAQRATLVGQRAPSIGFPGHGWGTKGAAGFGAVCSYWTPRRQYAGTYDAKWVLERKPLLPADFDPRFHMCAPADQQFFPHLRGGEQVELVHMTPSGVLRFTIPKVYLAFRTRILGKHTEHRANLVTVVVEPDVPRVITVWHTSIPCHHHADYLEETRIRQLRYV